MEVISSGSEDKLLSKPTLKSEGWGRDYRRGKEGRKEEWASLITFRTISSGV